MTGKQLDIDSQRKQSMTHQAEKMLKTVFGFDAFRAGQKEAIASLLANNSTLAVFPTGSGKSLCYQVPALCFSGLTVVVSPLIALMKDQVEFLAKKSIPAARLDSTLNKEELTAIYSQLTNSSLKILFVSPERLSNERFLARLQQTNIDLMTIDEAHCISEWGHNFRPEYLRLPVIAEKIGAKRVLCLTATATPDVATDICRQFNISPESYIHTGFYRPNLKLLFHVCDNASEKRDQLVNRLKQQPRGPTIVYVTLQKTAEDLASYLCDQGFSCQAYHAGMKTEDREAVQDFFMTSDQAIVTATIAFGMGIDKANIRYVYHYNMPKSLENYSQEIGRAGRDGLPSSCEMLANAEDITVLENFIYGDTPDPDNVKNLLEYILSQKGEFSLSVYEVSQKFDIRPLVVNTLFTYLQLMQIIDSKGHLYAEYKYQLIIPEDAIFQQFDPQRQDFLRKLFQQAKIGRIWHGLNIDEAAANLGEPRLRITKALEYLDDKSMIHLQVSGVKKSLEKIAKDYHIADLTADITKLIERNEQHNIARLNEVMKLVNHDYCQVNYLLNYFGEQRHNNCGHCSWCLGQKKSNLHRNDGEPGKRDIAALADELAKQGPLSHRQQAFLLCGITSPLITKRKFKTRSLFGRYAAMSFPKVLQLVKDIAQRHEK